jgi:hypothetical protein
MTTSVLTSWDQFNKKIGAVVHTLDLNKLMFLTRGSAAAKRKSLRKQMITSLVLSSARANVLKNPKS